MKKTALIIALATLSGVAYALQGDVPAPSIGMPGAAPKLYPSEQGAFKALEVATQVVESVIVQKGCVTNKFPFEVHTSTDGSGSALLGWAPAPVNLSIALDGSSTANGRRYSVVGGGTLAGLTISDISGKGSYNIGSMMQELKSYWKTQSPVTSLPDGFQGSIIKDYWRLSDLQPIPQGFDDAGVLVSTVVDYGYQQVSKNGYIKAKFWQNSRTWRDDGVNSGTYWYKQRVAPTGNCAIEVKIAGYGESPADNIEGFNEKGFIRVIAPSDVGPFFK